jgi:hypothetical protein
MDVEISEIILSTSVVSHGKPYNDLATKNCKDIIDV